MSRLLVAPLFTLVLAAPALAQPTGLQPGARVRIEALGMVAGKYEGTILARTADTLVVGAPNLTPIRLPIARVEGLEVSRGTNREDGARIGLKWGVPIMPGVGTAIVIAAASDNSCRTCSGVTGGEAVAFLAAAALGGAFYGASIGAFIGKER